ncbi:MAG: hypothetical protein IJR96_02685 [Pseudobutyrivibrio sp.]|nr:hypothetical protein [Pseudobutyrivibrio sp.]
MKKNKTVFIEICIVVAFIIIFLLTKMVGTTTVSDDLVDLDEKRYPIAKRVWSFL